jgi:glycolate oxidase
MNPIQQTDIDFFRSVLGEKFVLVDAESLTNNAHDQTEDLQFFPEVVLRPENPNEISSILKHCNQRNIPVTTRGGGTGLSGAALPVFGGVVLAMSRFDHIIEIDERNLQATVEPGVITQVFQEAVIEKGLFYPPDPSSRGTCFIGGNLAHCSGGPRAVKYGVTRDYVLDLEVVLASGEIIHTGAKVLKNSTGYNLTQLMIGSEGTLAVITKVVFKLLPYPRMNKVLLAPFRSPLDACAAVSAIFRAGIIPSALEFMERDAIDWTLKFRSDINIQIGEDEQAHLLIEVDGNDEETILKDIERIVPVLEEHRCMDILFAESDAQKTDLWKLRRSVAEAVKSNSTYKEEDTVVPRAELPALLTAVKEIGAKYGFKSVCYGHAGDGNLHVNIIKGDLTEEQWKTDVTLGIRELFTRVVELGGTLSGEHGIGLVQQPYMDIAFNKIQLDLMRGIKATFDPNNILNPGKIFTSPLHPGDTQHPGDSSPGNTGTTDNEDTQVYEGSGRFLWHDLTVKDASKVSEFYEKVTGWERQSFDMGGYNDYVMSPEEGEDPIAGICYARGSNKDIPPQWLMYVNVKNLDKSLEKCTLLGGKVIGEKRKMGDDGKYYCLIQDPAGAFMMICG